MKKQCLEISSAIATMGHVEIIFDIAGFEIKNGIAQIDPGSWGTAIYVYSDNSELLQGILEIIKEIHIEKNITLSDTDLIIH